MSWVLLSRLGVTVRPLSMKPEQGFRRAQFRATFSQTISLLHRELRELQAENIVLELDYRERDIRLDGLPRADARLGYPAVVLSFGSKHGPLRYATAEYNDWHDNLRAIALSMEALRAVDRYGVSKRGEQYTGWKQLESPGAAMSAEAASDLLASYGGEMAALKATHPDKGGSTEEFHRVQEARRVLALR